MLNKTHIAIGLFFMLFFLSSVVHVWTYVLVFAVAALFPNLDRFLYLKGFRFFRKTNSSNRNRGFFHSFTLCFIITFILAWFLPRMAFPFFLGYGTHLIADSWTVEGIVPFWPLKYSSKGRIKRGGGFENMLFYSFVIADIVLIGFLFF